MENRADNLKILVFGALVLGAAAYVGLKLYIYTSVKDVIDQVLSRVTTSGRIEYGGISSSLTSGTVSIDDIVIAPPGMSEEIRIESAKIRGPGLRFLLTASGELQSKGVLPEYMSVALEGVELELRGELLASLSERDEKRRAKEQDRVCSPFSGLGLGQIHEMGVDIARLNVETGYRFRAGAGGVDVFLGYQAVSMQSLDLSMTLEGFTPQVLSFVGKVPMLEKFSLVWRLDPRFAKMGAAYCAEQQDMAVADYLDDLIEDHDQHYLQTFGFLPGPGLKTALRRFLTPPHELRVEGDPPSAVDLGTVQAYAERDIPALLGISVAVNGDPVTDLSFQVSAGLRAMADGSGSKGAVGQSKAASDPAADRASRPQPEGDTRPRSLMSYRSVEVSALGGFKGHHVRLSLSDGRVREGTMTSVDRDQAVIVRHAHGGSLSSNVLLAEVRSAEVLR